MIIIENPPFSRKTHLFKKILRIFLILSVLFVLLTVEKSASADMPVGKIVFTKGRVTIRKLGAEKAEYAAVGSPIFTGYTLETGEDGVAQIVFSDDSFINLLTETSIRIHLFLFNADSNERKADVKILSGNVRVISYKERNKNSLMNFWTGNTFVSFCDLVDVTVSAKPTVTEVVNLKGIVRVRNSSHLIIGEVRPGFNQKTIVINNHPPSTPKAITLAERQKQIKRFKNGLKN